MKKSFIIEYIVFVDKIVGIRALYPAHDKTDLFGYKMCDLFKQHRIVKDGFGNVFIGNNSPVSVNILVEQSEFFRIDRAVNDSVFGIESLLSDYLVMQENDSSYTFGNLNPSYKLKGNAFVGVIFVNKIGIHYLGVDIYQIFIDMFFF